MRSIILTLGTPTRILAPHLWARSLPRVPRTKAAWVVRARAQLNCRDGWSFNRRPKRPASLPSSSRQALSHEDAKMPFPLSLFSRRGSQPLGCRAELLRKFQYYLPFWTAPVSQAREVLTRRTGRYLVEVAKSWLSPPKLEVKGEGFQSAG